MTLRIVPPELLQSDELPSLPTVAVEVLRLCRKEDTTLDDLAEAIARDPALSLKLLRYSNSTMFNLGSEVTTLQRATLVLGMKSVQLMSLSFSLASSLPRTGQGFDYDGFWRRSLASAVAARLLTSLTGRPGEEEAFLSGLIGDLGQLVMAQGEDRYTEVVEAAGDAWPSVPHEASVLGYHRGDVAREMLDAWKLPAMIQYGVGYAHTPEDLPEDTPDMIRDVVELLHVARLAVEVLCDGSGTSLAELERQCADRYSLSDEHVGSYLLALESAFREASELLDLPMPTDRSHEDILADARDAMLQVSLRSAAEPQGEPSTADLSHRESIPETDELCDAETGLLGEEGFSNYVRAEVRARRQSPQAHALGLLRIDVDGLATLVEECAGAADGLLELDRSIATVLRRMTRKGDVPVRLGPGRFAVLVPQAAPFGLRTLAERVRIGVSQLAVQVSGSERKLTVSSGGACLGRASREGDGDALREVAERYLARIVAEGGNATQVHATVIQLEAAA